jgi:putative ABC transport system permease protein
MVWLNQPSIAYNVNLNPVPLLERLLARAIGDRLVAETIAGDLAEERVRWRAWHLILLTLRFAARRRPRIADSGPRIRVRRSTPMANLLQDVRYAARVLVRQPGFSVIVILTLGIGLGANAAVFAMVDALLFRPLPVANVDGMVEVFQTNVSQGEDREYVSAADFLDWQRQARSFDRLVAFDWWDANISDRTMEPEQVVGRRVSIGFFEALQVRPSIGRTLAAGEDTIGRNRVVIVSDKLWQRRWGGSPSLIGSTITVDRERYTVVGIAPAGFDYPSATDLWAPLTFDEAALTNRSRRFLEVIGRLKPGISIEQSRREMQEISARLATEHRDTNAGYGVNVMPLWRAMVDIGLPAVLAVVQVAVALVFLIAGANVANLLTVRGASRQRELTLRLAVGASRWRIVRQLIVESVMLSVVGVALAVPIAAGGLRIMKRFMPPEIARWIFGWNEMDVDGRLLGLTMIAGVVAGVVFGAIPALRASRPDLSDAMKEGARSTGGRRRVLEGFVIGQVALALALLVSAGLATRGAVTLLVQNDGYEPRGVMTFGLTLPASSYPNGESQLRFYEEVLTRVRALPGVQHASFSTTVPFSYVSNSNPVEVEGRQASKASERPQIDYRAMTPDYFSVIRASILEGRGILETDRMDTPRIAVIDRSMADRLWPGANPIGKRFRPAHQINQPWLTVVGIASNVKHDWFFGFRPTYYVPYAQLPRDWGMLAVRTTGDENAIAPAVRQVFREIDPDLPLASVHSLLRWRSLKTIGISFVAGLMAAFAGIGLFLSAIGVYGVMAYSVSQRTREIGVRMALGATTREVLGMTLRNAVMLATIGIVIGLVAAFGLGKLLVANLFGVVQLDVMTFAVFALVLAVVAIVAASVPARRAMRVDPIAALRAE